MSHHGRVISLTVKEGTEFLLTNSAQKADHVIFLFLLGERTGKKKHRKTPEQCTECRVLQLTTEPAKHIR